MGQKYLSSTTVTDKHELEGRAGGRGSSFGHGVDSSGGGGVVVWRKGAETVKQKVLVDVARSS